ncbi:YadA C-terminal domain-containing protein [Salmonella enterica]|uniref:YadA C-terminal domain-containing protein n=1 Tax=Salmonella enterica TaxID=28901 RepID=UPI00098ECDBB|nr:YadA C-terminal domain-containing protein [Salmonella enterica]EBF8300120.1 hypothetical protein [Salmonella enterica subsp. enterica serovar Mbandaka]ECR4426289.1 hypothetical protein [Salmonella enterica subsp. enterica]
MRFKLMSFVLCVPLSLTSNCLFATTILDDVSFTVDDNGHVSFEHEPDSNMISKCERLASEPCASLDEVAGGLNQAVDYMKGYADQSSAQAIIDVNTYTDNSSKNAYNKSVEYTNSQINTVNGRIDHLDSKIDKNRQKASAGIAGAMAMSSIPQNLSYDFNFGMGMANFDSEQAISAGGYYRVNERTIVSVKSSFDTQNNLGAAAGVSYGW